MVRRWLAGLLVLGCLGRATPAAAEEAPPIDAWWGQVQGLMAGITYAHAIQPIAVVAGELEWKDKHMVAIAGTALYGTSLAGLLQRRRWGLQIAIYGPLVGTSTVLLGWTAGALGWTQAEIRPDAFQIAGGVLQGLALVRSVQLLRADPRSADSGRGRAKRTASLGLQVDPTGRSLSLCARF